MRDWSANETPNRWPRATLAFAAGLLLLGAACGGEAEAPTDESQPTAGGALNITIDDNSFEPGEILVRPGQTVTFTLTHEGAAVHNMRIAGPDGEFNTDDDTVSDPEVINSGELGKVEWTAPDETGQIDFRCDFHPDEQRGTISVG